MTTALDFDPYFAWLRVSASERPLNPYQLLGLPPLESDSTRIRDAADRKLSLLGIEREQADPQLWQQIHDEIAAATAVLVNPQQKALLDASLKRREQKQQSRPNGGPNGAAKNGPAGGTVHCRGCQQSNQASRRYCAACGHSLWERCLQCKAECSADERFCGTCGADVHRELANLQAQYQATIHAAQQHAASFHFDEALAKLHKLAALEDIRFESFANQALAELTRLQAEQEEHQQQAARTFAKAKQVLESHAYDAALQLLREISEPLQTAEMKALQQQAERARNEVARLGAEIRAAMEEKRTWDLLPKLERMLVLRPNHTQVQQLAVQLRDQFLKQAKKKLSEHKYAEALETLEQIPSTTRTPDVEALADKARELESLFDGVQSAPLANKVTLDLAEKLVKIAPSNAAAVALREQLRKRANAPPSNPRSPVASFAPPSERRRIELPIEWLGHFAQLTGHNDSVATCLRQHPGQFFVALGLALQGVGLAAININLAPQEKSRLLGALSMSLTPRRGPQYAWGLDWSDTGLKALKLSHDPRSQTTKIEACEYRPHRLPLNVPDAELIGGEIGDETLRDFLSRNDVKDAKICCGISSQRVLGRFFELPPMPGKKVPDAVQFEAKHQIPIPLDELRWAYHLQSETTGKATDGQPRQVLLAATRSSHVGDRIQTFKNAGIAVDIVQSECIALHNAAVFEFFSQRAAGEGEAVGLIDVGAESTNVVISTPREIWFRTVGIGGQAFTSALVKQLQLTHEQAEQLKREPARARRYHLLRAATAPLLTQLRGETERSLASYQKSHPGQKLRCLYGLGGGFEQDGLLRHFHSA